MNKEMEKVLKQAEKKLSEFIKQDSIKFIIFATGLSKKSATQYYNRYRKINKL